MSIELVNFSKSYSSRKNAAFAVKNVNMTCKDGEITGILGLNGAGKTTILKAVCARHFATDGKILVNGIDAQDESERVRSLTGFVMEQPLFQSELFVCEYLAQIAALHGIYDTKEKQSLAEAMSKVKKLCSLDSVWSKKIGSLSKGFRERLNFAQALIYDPPVLVLDEPASGLDPSQILKMRALVQSLKKNHTILLSTHLMQEVAALCDSVYIIDNGQCVAFGTPDSIAAENNCKTLEEAFFKLTKESET